MQINYVVHVINNRNVIQFTSSHIAQNGFAGMIFEVKIKYVLDQDNKIKYNFRVWAWV